jgi:hypothetical protein
MFGLDNHTVAAGQGGNNRPSAIGVARIDTNLTHVLLSPDTVEGLAVFFNSRPIPTGSLESVGIEIVAPTDANPQGALTAILSRYAGETGSTGNRPQTSQPLFPGTVEIVARGRRIVVSCREAGSFDGLWLGLGLREDGTSTELTGVRSLRIVVTPTIVDARLVWDEDGSEEDLLVE